MYRWGLGPIAQRKKGLIKEGKLDKYGRKNDKTPSDYLSITNATNTAGGVALIPGNPPVATSATPKVKESKSESHTVKVGGSN